MKISTRDKLQVFDPYAMISHLPALKPGDTFVVYQETSKMPPNQIDKYLTAIADALVQYYPMNPVFVAQMINGVKQTDFEIK